MSAGQYCCNKDHAVHQVIFEKRNIFKFFFYIIIRICKNDLISFFRKNITDSCGFPADGIGIDLRQDHSYQSGLLGPEHLRL